MVSVYFQIIFYTIYTLFSECMQVGVCVCVCTQFIIRIAERLLQLDSQEARLWKMKMTRTELVATKICVLSSSLFCSIIHLGLHIFDTLSKIIMLNWGLYKIHWAFSKHFIDSDCIFILGTSNFSVTAV